jgi:hypothetical protein
VVPATLPAFNWPTHDEHGCDGAVAGECLRAGRSGRRGTSSDGWPRSRAAAAGDRGRFPIPDDGGIVPAGSPTACRYVEMLLRPKAGLEVRPVLLRCSTCCVASALFSPARSRVLGRALAENRVVPKEQRAALTRRRARD